MSNRRQIVIAIAFYSALLLTALAYWPGLKGELMFDDFVNLDLMSELDAGKITWEQAVLHNDSGPLGRPVAMLTFAANVLTSGPDVWTYKYTNLIIHLLCGCLVFWVGGRLMLALPVLAPHRWMWALWISAAWLFSPLLVSTVIYVVQRMAQLSALLCLAGLLMYAIGRQNIERDFRKGIGFILAAFLVCWPAATFSKETGALFPALAFLVEIFIFRMAGTPLIRRLLWWLFGITLFLPAVATVLLLCMRPDFVLKNYPYRGFTFFQRIITEPRIMGDYLQQLVLPQGGRMGLFHDDYPISTGPLSPPVTLFWLVFWPLALWMGWRQRASSHRAIWFGLWFFVAAQLLESTIFPLELYFEHRNYLASFGIYFAVAAIFSSIPLKSALTKRRLIYGLLATVPLFYAVAMAQRVLAWRNTAQTLLTMEPSHLKSQRVASELAVWFSQHGDYENAEKRLKRLDRLRRSDSGAAAIRLLVDCLENKPVSTEEKQQFGRVQDIAVDGLTTSALIQIAKLKSKNQCAAVDNDYLADLIGRWWRNTRRLPNPNVVWNLHIAMANIFRTDKRYPAAVAHLQAATAMRPNETNTSLLEILVRLDQGNVRAARDVLDSIIRKNKHQYQYQEIMIDYYRRLFAALSHRASASEQK